MDAIVTCNVTEIENEKRQTFEGILGGPLASNQQVLIMAYTPGELPGDAVRAQATHRLEQALAKNQAFAQGLGVTAAEADEAVAEAMQQIRRRE